MIFKNKDVEILYKHVKFETIESDMEDLQNMAKEITFDYDLDSRVIYLIMDYIPICEFTVNISYGVLQNVELIDAIPISEKLKSDIYKLANTMASKDESVYEYEDCDLVIDEYFLNR